MDVIKKRDGRIVNFEPEKITSAIYRAAVACRGNDFGQAVNLCEKVMEKLNLIEEDHAPDVEEVQDMVEKVLIENGHAMTAKA